MKKATLKIAMMALAFVSLMAMSCKGNKKDNTTDVMHSDMSSGYEAMHHNTMNTSNAQNPDAKQVLANYMELKNALVATNKEEAAKASKNLESSLNGFDVSVYAEEQQQALKDIIADAREHAGQINKSDMEQQREHFKLLSNAMMDMVAITGTERTLYQQFCPMYDGGSAWLSMEKDIKNPYYGNKMLACGKVQKEIN